MEIIYKLIKTPEGSGATDVIGVVICCADMKKSIKSGFIEINEEENQPNIEYDTDGRWIENPKYCHHCGKKIEMIMDRKS